MPALSDLRFVLFYQPPNGKWYVHSHKLYLQESDARDAAREFLAPGTPICIRSVWDFTRGVETV